MKRMFFLLPIVILFIAGGCQVNKVENKAKYVFLFIGDGMGANQVYASELYLAALNNEHGNAALNFSNFPVESYVTTYSANSLITCSSASGTAIASGFKTNNGYLNKDTSLTIEFETIAQKVKKAGRKIGILSSVAIDHATPAAFYAHQNLRSMYYEISMEMPNYGFDYFGGGGLHYPNGKNDSLPNAFENAIAKGYTITDTHESFEALKNGDEKVFAMNPELYPQGEFYWEIDKKEGSISLADFTKKGIEVIDNPAGFFMMVEGGKIDWACHGNDIATTLHETLAFDAAVAEAIAFYKNHSDETLIIVTADHETGGLGMGINKPLNLGVLQHQNISAQEFGRKLLTFKNEKPNASFKEVLSLIEANFGLGNKEKGMELTKAELEYLHKGYALEFVSKVSSNPDDEYLEETVELLITDRVIKLMSLKAGIGWTTPNHSGTPVPIRAMGVGQEFFSSTIDNTDISKIIEKVMGI
jgi:alkaline phosphatase